MIALIGETTFWLTMLAVFLAAIYMLIDSFGVLGAIGLIACVCLVVFVMRSMRGV